MIINYKYNIISVDVANTNISVVSSDVLESLKQNIYKISDENKNKYVQAQMEAFQSNILDELCDSVGITLEKKQKFKDLVCNKFLNQGQDSLDFKLPSFVRFLDVYFHTNKEEMSFLYSDADIIKVPVNQFIVTVNWEIVGTSEENPELSYSQTGETSFNPNNPKISNNFKNFEDITKEEVISWIEKIDISRVTFSKSIIAKELQKTQIQSNTILNPWSDEV